MPGSFRGQVSLWCPGPGANRLQEARPRSEDDAARLENSIGRELILEATKSRAFERMAACAFTLQVWLVAALLLVRALGALWG